LSLGYAPIDFLEQSANKLSPNEKNVKIYELFAFINEFKLFWSSSSFEIKLGV